MKTTTFNLKDKLQDKKFFRKNGKCMFFSMIK